MSNTKTSTEVAPVIVSDMEILHRADETRGIRITRIQRISYHGVLKDARFWTDLATGNIHHIELAEVK